MKNGVIFDSVFIDPGVYQDLVVAAAEVLPNESTGYVRGIPNCKSIRVVATNALQEAKRQKTYVSEKDPRGVGRIARLEKIFNSYRNSLMLGGFHTHPGRDCLAEISEEDLDFVKSKLRDSDSHLWLELILKIAPRRYKRKDEEKVTIRNYARKLRSTIRTTPQTGYDSILAGYLIDRQGAHHELTVRVR